MFDDSKNVKRRSNLRYGINLEANIVIEGSVPVSCKIANFCFGGLFLNTKQFSETPSLLTNKNIKIQFTLSPENGGEHFQIDAKVVRVDSEGLGVAAAGMTTQVYEALKQAAAYEAEGNYSDRRKASSNKSNQEKFKKSLEILLHERLPLLFMEFSKKAMEDLEQAIECANNDNQRTAINDLIVRLKQHGNQIGRTFCKTVILEINKIAAAKQQKQTLADMQETTLALIENDDFEDWLNITSLIRNLTSQYANQLNQMEQKLRFVMDIPDGKVNNPVSPEILCRNFQLALSEIQESYANKQILYKSFGKTLLAGLRDLYVSADQLLVEHGAPEQAAIVIRKLEDKTRQAQATQDYGELDYEELPEAASGLGRQQQHPRSASQALALTQSPPPNRCGRNKQPIGQTLGNLLNILNDVKGGSKETRIPVQENRNAPVQSHSVYSSDELSHVLAQLQANKFNISDMHRDSAALQKHLVDALERSGNSPKILSADHANKLEIYGRFFDTLFNDLILSSDIKAYMETIHLSLMTLAMQGAEFLNTEEHPIGSIINNLACLESAVKGNKIIFKMRIKKALDEIMTRLARESVVNPDTLITVDQELKEITAPVTKTIEKNIGRVIVTYENRQKLENARQSVQNDIDKHLAGKSVPKIVKFFLDSAWLDLMVLAELNGEHNGAVKQDFIRVVDDLLAWYSQQEPFSEEQISSIKNLLAFIGKQLTAGFANAFYLDRPIMVELTETLLGSGMPCVRKPVEMVLIEPDSAMPTVNSEDNLNRLSEQWQAGDWFLRSHEGEEPEPLKLVWIGDTLDALVFVNRDGFKKLELTREEMTDLMRSGRIVKTESFDAPLMERATNTMMQKMHTKLVYNAAHDPITGLINKKELIRLLKQKKPDFSNCRDIFCQIELLNYRTIDNLCGISGSDEMLKNLADLISIQLRSDDILARLGDQTFGIFLQSCSQEEGQQIAQRIVNHIDQYSFKWKEKSYPIAISIGMVAIETGCDIESLFQKAGSACILAKKSGSNRIQCYKDDDENLKIEADMLEWVGLIDRIFLEKRLFIRCQMIAPINLQKNSHSHYEILLGITDETGNVIAPDQFIPAVERCRRMPEIDRWVVENAFRWIENNSGVFDKLGGFAINLSGQSLNSEKFLAFLLDRLASGKMTYEKITFEVTESVAAANIGFTRKFIKQVKQFGCKFSLDDFGSGYSSYSYLKDLDLDYLKIDGAFIKDLAGNQKDVAIVKSINEIGHSLGLETIAEYVENAEIYTILKTIGVDYAQGWGIQKPVLLEHLAS